MRLTTIHRPTATLDMGREPTDAEREAWRKSREAEMARYQVWCIERGLDADAEDLGDEQRGAFEADEFYDQFRSMTRGVTARSAAEFCTGHGLREWLVSGRGGLAEPDGPMVQAGKPMALTLHLHLAGVGHMAATIESRKTELRHTNGTREIDTRLHDTVRIAVYTASRVLMGEIVDAHRCWFVSLSDEQALAQAIADYWARFTSADLPSELAAYLAPRWRCFQCNRPLADEASKVIGYGPDCAGRLGIPHSHTEADKVLRDRAARGLEFRRLLEGAA